MESRKVNPSGINPARRMTCFAAAGHLTKTSLLPVSELLAQGIKNNAERYSNICDCLPELIFPPVVRFFLRNFDAVSLW